MLRTWNDVPIHDFMFWYMNSSSGRCSKHRNMISCSGESWLGWFHVSEHAFHDQITFSMSWTCSKHNHVPEPWIHVQEHFMYRNLISCSKLVSGSWFLNMFWTRNLVLRHDFRHTPSTILPQTCSEHKIMFWNMISDAPNHYHGCLTATMIFKTIW